MQKGDTPPLSAKAKSIARYRKRTAVSSLFAVNDIFYTR